MRFIYPKLYGFKLCGALLVALGLGGFLFEAFDDGFGHEAPAVD